MWNATSKAGYLATIPDPDRALQQTLDPHIVAILKRVPMLQDYQLLAAPLPEESAAWANMEASCLDAAHTAPDCVG